MTPLLRVPTADEVVAKAQLRAGRLDFGETPFRNALEHFLNACRDEADLSLFGRLAVRWDTERFLRNLLRLREEELRRPEILGRRIERPIFITGLPRSGTTFLHSLLAEDRGNLAPRVWQPIHPYPPKPPRIDRRRQKVARQLRLFGMLAPEFSRVHPIDADSPQECSEITAHVFASLRFDTTYRIPSYRRWLDETGHLDAYRFHKRFLQHLQDQAGDAARPWVLKCPDHVFALGAIRSIYPDARIVFVHRDPLAVLRSVARLTEVLRRPFTRRIDKVEIGRQDSERWLDAAGLMIAAGDDEPFAEPIFHVRYPELTKDPLGTVAALYRHFGLALTPDATRRIRRFIEAKPNGGYGTRHYRLEDHGLDAAHERERYAGYLARFEIRPEIEAGAVPPAKGPSQLRPRASAASGD